MVTATFKQYVDDDRYVKNHSYPFTFIADLLTGVVQREESLVCSRKILDKWSEGLKEVEIKEAGRPVYVSDKTGKSILPHTVSVAELPTYAEKIVQDLGLGKGGVDERGKHVRMERLAYRDGHVKITFTRNWEGLA